MNRLLLCRVACVYKAGVGVLAPAAALEATPVANAVAVVSLEDITKAGGQVTLPEGAIRLAVSIKVGFDEPTELKGRVFISTRRTRASSAKSTDFLQEWE